MGDLSKLRENFMDRNRQTRNTPVCMNIDP